jgi:microcystin-dependent protein
MITTIQSAITTVNVERLKSNLELLGVTVLEIRPARLVGETILPTEVDLDGEIVGEMLDECQACVDNGAVDEDDTKLRKSGGDFATFPAKNLSKKDDLLIVEDSDNLNAKKKLKIGSINHGDLSNIGTKSHSQIDAHINSSSNPHNTTAAQVGLGNVTNDAQIKRSADHASFAEKTLPEEDDTILIEDSSDSSHKKRLKLESFKLFSAHVKSFNGRTGDVVPQANDIKWSDLDLTNSSIGQLTNKSHHELTEKGQHTHQQIDIHITSKANPHEVSKAQIGLQNVSDDAQLKRSAEDFVSFPLKEHVSVSDLLLIEDSEDGHAKKKILAFSLIPTGTVLPYAGTAAPYGFKLCDGSVLNISTNNDLFAVVGTHYNDGTEAPGMFRLPDLRQRLILGKAVEGTGSVLGEKGGTIDHTHTGGQHKHFLEPHTHIVPGHHHGMGADASFNIVFSGAHEHSLKFELGDIVAGDKQIAVLGDQPTEQLSGQHRHPASAMAGRLGNVALGNDGDAGFSTENASCETDRGGQVATTSNNPPYVVLNYIIKG